MKAYKSLEAYNQFISGWVRDRGAAVHGQYVILTAKVLMSNIWYMHGVFFSFTFSFLAWKTAIRF